MRKIYSLLAVITAFTFATAQTTVTEWTFDSASNVANTGTGTISLIGGVVENVQGASGTYPNLPYVGGNPSTGAAYATKNYPAQSVASGTAGIQFVTSTTGYKGIEFSVDVYGSNTASRTIRGQYTIDGINWIDVGEILTLSASTWGTIKSGSINADDSAELAFRIVSVFDPSTGGISYSAIKGSYAIGGALRYDNAKVIASSTLAIEDINPSKNKTILSHTLIQDQVSIKLEGTSKVEFYSMNGTLVKTVTVTANQPINTQDLGKGAYLVRVINGNKIEKVKVIKK